MKIGCNGSIAHVLSNDKIEDKKSCLKELYKEAGKDTVTLAAGTVGAVTVASNAGNIKNFASKLTSTPVKDIAAKGIQTAKSFIKNPKEIAGKAVDVVKNNFTPSKIIEKAKALPTPVKAAIAAGVALFGVYSAAKSGYIEGKHEAK